TADGKEFVEGLWARRKVGFLLDQIRINGEKKELVDEVMTLARRYGITTPYTSWLIVPDAPTPLAAVPPWGRGVGGGGGPGRKGKSSSGGGFAKGGPAPRPSSSPPPGLMPVDPRGGVAPTAPLPVIEFARAPGDLKARRDAEVKSELDRAAGEKGDGAG